MYFVYFVVQTNTSEKIKPLNTQNLLRAVGVAGAVEVSRREIAVAGEVSRREIAVAGEVSRREKL